VLLFSSHLARRSRQYCQDRSGGERVDALAKFDFSRVRSISDVVALFQERAAMGFQRLSLENYTQTHLAWGLSLISLGEASEGRRHLELFCARFSIDRNDRILQEALLTAENMRHSR
jgi:hypothetical protein